MHLHWYLNHLHTMILFTGGFGEIEPKIQIGGRYNRGLPTAQTCFNVIYLPTGHYHYQDFERAVLTAFNEGGLGFGLV